MNQFEALGAGVKRVDGTMVLREGWGAKQVLKSLLWLRRENLNRGHIYVRPAGAHGLSLVDDLKAATLVRMKADGFAPAAVVETSPGNFQAWLKHGQVLDEADSTRHRIDSARKPRSPDRVRRSAVASRAEELCFLLIRSARISHWERMRPICGAHKGSAASQRYQSSVDSIISTSGLRF